MPGHRMLSRIAGCLCFPTHAQGGGPLLMCDGSHQWSFSNN
ncbi:exported hypothetical protein [Cupriavidus taiwanensis]|uniref:Uncharacterized protein n=1 Tax=Cupriavidus taiwanensis TaxID=164546 RepID=A0A375EC90_9BURK|nr:exported hypothetical protein [Cupriavidus taiwanensis]SOZ70348.1 exported hypothetical protein [Cupriavidus taiwanensis]SOZ73252.1 exported hypothetical protein [Cupriavidus taiwanensis]SPA10120.1 exported hypothetical protein [Cupriavidus taiwanensis]